MNNDDLKEEIKNQITLSEIISKKVNLQNESFAVQNAGRVLITRKNRLRILFGSISGKFFQG